MNHADYEVFLAEDARLVILKALARESNVTLNETIITKVLDTFGHHRSRDWVRTQVGKLRELGAIKVTEAGSVLIATLTQAGLDHVERRSVISGIATPSLGV